MTGSWRHDSTELMLSQAQPLYYATIPDAPRSAPRPPLHGFSAKPIRSRFFPSGVGFAGPSLQLTIASTSGIPNNVAPLGQTTPIANCYGPRYARTAFYARSRDQFRRPMHTGSKQNSQIARRPPLGRCGKIYEHRFVAPSS